MSTPEWRMANKDRMRGNLIRWRAKQRAKKRAEMEAGSLSRPAGRQLSAVRTPVPRSIRSVSAPQVSSRPARVPMPEGQVGPALSQSASPVASQPISTPTIFRLQISADDIRDAREKAPLAFGIAFCRRFGWPIRTAEQIGNYAKTKGFVPWRDKNGTKRCSSLP